MRHAKSSWDNPDLADVDRPLSARGRHAARKMGRRLAKRHADPDLIVSSPAVRALKTARILARRLNHPRRGILVNPRIYACTAEHLWHTVQVLEDRFLTVILVGHNPEITALAHRFCGQITHMPTCAVVRLRFDIDCWRDIGTTMPLQTEFDYPKRPKRGRT
ncbi:MAG TPA: histidine phosphatase family protein [Steroidobacteraceae bacterium]|nr:histidine phosphatase family protein [Steroidobacteraceae bacterium]